MMKKNIICLFFCVFAINAVFLNAQEFSFQIYFEDAEGNRDTIIIGYDPSGYRNVILPEFGEENIAGVPFDSVFDVRITNQADINGAGWNYNYELYHTKKKIINLFSNVFPDVNIDIHAQHWPVTATWDPELFNNPQLNGSLLTPWHNQFWWDFGWYYSDFDKVVFRETDHVTFAANYPDNWEEHPVDDFFCYYVDEAGRPIATYWTALGDSSWLYLDVENMRKANNNILYPNPTNGIIYIDQNPQLIKTIEVFNINGQQYAISVIDNKIDVSTLINGVYFFRIHYHNGRIKTQKIIKK